MAIKKIAVLSSLVYFVCAPLRALDIPLSGETGTGKGGASIGYVDMDKIFQIFPQTQAAKEDYMKQLQKKKDQLAAKESELADIQNRVSVLESTLKQNPSAPPVATSSGTVSSTSTAPSTADALAGASQNLVKMKKDLDDRKAELEDLRKQAQSDLSTYQTQQSQIILGKIYEALREVALEQQVNVVVDKSSILYGDATIDLTDKLQQRVRGY
jgi:Skp family chaperone for outer membrane proteins